MSTSRCGLDLPSVTSTSTHNRGGAASTSPLVKDQVQDDRQSQRRRHVPQHANWDDEHAWDDEVCVLTISHHDEEQAPPHIVDEIKSGIFSISDEDYAAANDELRALYDEVRSNNELIRQRNAARQAVSVPSQQDTPCPSEAIASSSGVGGEGTYGKSYIPTSNAEATQATEDFIADLEANEVLNKLKKIQEQKKVAASLEQPFKEQDLYCSENEEEDIIDDFLLNCGLSSYNDLPEEFPHSREEEIPEVQKERVLPIHKEQFMAWLKDEEIPEVPILMSDSTDPPREEIMGPASYAPATSRQPYADIGSTAPDRPTGGFAWRNSHDSLPPAQAHQGAIFILPQDLGLAGEVFARWEATTLNYVAQQFPSNGADEITFIENLLGPDERKIFIQWRIGYPANYEVAKAQAVGVNGTHNVMSQIKRFLFFNDPVGGATIGQEEASYDLKKLPIPGTHSKAKHGIRRALWQTH